VVLLSTTTGDPTVGQPAPEIQAAPFLRNHGDDILKKRGGEFWSLGIMDLWHNRRGIAGAHSGANERAYDPLASPRQLVAIVATLIEVSR